MEQLTPNIKIQDGDHSYTLQEYIGAGSYGEVWKAVNDATGEEVAIKFYIMLDERGREEFMSEYQIAYGLYHKNLLTASFLGTWENRPFLVMRYCSKGSAARLVGTLEPTPENENLLWRFIRDVAAGLACLHGQEPDPIVHQDIKPDNILIDNDDNFVITDFGISKKIRSTMRSQSNRSAKAGAVAYMGPERFSSHPTPIMASDIWSLGASIYEIAMGELPFYGQGGNMLRNGADMPEVDSRWSDDLRNVIYLCLAKEPWDRIKAFELEEFAQNILDSRLAGGPGFDPRKTQRKVEVPFAPEVAAPAAAAPVAAGPATFGPENMADGPQAASPGGKPKKSHKSLIITLVAVLLAGGGFAAWFFSTADKRHAHSQIEAYTNYVAACRTYIQTGDARNYKALLDGKVLLDTVLAYDFRYSKYYPEVFGDYYSLVDDMDYKLDEACRSWAKAANSQKMIGNFGNAADYSRLAVLLLPNYPDSTLTAGLYSLCESLAYMKVGDVEINYHDEDDNLLDEGSDGLYAKNVNSINFFLKYNGILDEDTDDSVVVKFYGGWNDALTKEVPLTVLANSSASQYPYNIFLTSWGYDKGSHYSPGNYRVEIWKGDNNLFGKSFILK